MGCNLVGDINNAIQIISATISVIVSNSNLPILNPDDGLKIWIPIIKSK
jgi:hypothetical protein